MLEYLADDLANLNAETKNSGGLLAQDEKEGVERLIEGLQLVPWASMLRSTKPHQSKLPAMTSLLGAKAEPQKTANEESKVVGNRHSSTKPV